MLALQFELKDGLPIIPEGYRLLLTGEALQQGDLWADKEFESWEPTRSWKRAMVIADGDLYIRKLDAKDSVPFAQQKQLS